MIQASQLLSPSVDSEEFTETLACKECQSENVLTIKGSCGCRDCGRLDYISGFEARKYETNIIHL